MLVRLGIVGPLMAVFGMFSLVPVASLAQDKRPLPRLRMVYTDTSYVEADHITVREIVQRAARGERGKLAGHNSITYTATVRSIVRWDKKKEISDEIYRAYDDAAGNARFVAINNKTEYFKLVDGEWQSDPDKKDEDKNDLVKVENGNESVFTDLPLFLEEDHEFDFKLLERSLEGEHVIFKIGFTPKSEFKPIPAGEVYIQTPSYRIIHESYWFDRNPAPLFLKGFRRIARHWQRLESGEWVATKIMGELELRSDPFGWMPKSISFGLLQTDFAFDVPYNEELFGAFNAPSFANSGPPRKGEFSDESEVGQLVAGLQKDDLDYYREIQQTDAGFREQSIAQHDSLGLDGLRRVMSDNVRPFDFGLGLAEGLLDYNRVDGLLLGGGAELEFGRRIPLQFDLEVGYGLASEELRYLTRARAPFRVGGWDMAVAGKYQERVEPFGSNRPGLNAVRALMIGADEQDYLLREGGGAWLRASRKEELTVSLGGGAYNERQVSANTDFGVFTNIDRDNAAIDVGREQYVFGEILWRPERRLELGLRQRLAGGALGGDFRFARTDAWLSTRRFVVGDHELVAEIKAATVHDSPPAQQLADIGGVSTVRGFERRSLLGRDGFAVRAEYPMPYDIFRRARVPVLSWIGAQIVPWFDAGRVWGGTSGEWIHSAGLGLQFHMVPVEAPANLRVDFAFPTSADPLKDNGVTVHFLRTF